MTKPQPCPTCQRKQNPELWECSRVECPTRKAVMSVPSDTYHREYEPMLDGYVSRPRLED